jgi:hypothetical protein
MIPGMNAVATDAAPFVAAKNFSRPEVLAATLGTLGLVQASSSMTKLQASGVKLSVFDVDSALKNVTSLKLHEKIALKIAIERAGLFEAGR